LAEINTDAMKLVAQKNMKEIFGCARMYFNTIPNLLNENIYGVTTFELG
jgi:N-acyl-L-homoserine lactone synthetase